MNRVRERITRIKHDRPGLHAARRIQPAASSNAINSVPRNQHLHPGAGLHLLASIPAEVVVEHEERAAGESKYSLYSLIRLNFDLMTGFSVLPLQLVLDARHRRLPCCSAALFVLLAWFAG
jgi:undecaprenyl-phosphate 4-deoxy-4-formamido-L-arabinose transferase